MPSRKDDPDARLTIGYSSYRLPRSGLVQRPFATHRQRRRQTTATVCRIPCRILYLADVDIWARYLFCECVDWLDDTLSTNSQAGFGHTQRFCRLHPSTFSS